MPSGKRTVNRIMFHRRPDSNIRGDHMDEPEKPEEPKKNPRDRKAPIRDRGPRPDEKSQTFRGGRRATVRGTTGGMNSHQ